METRREFLKNLIVVGGTLAFCTKVFSEKSPMHRHSENTSAIVYRAANGTPAQNIIKVVEMMGGVQNITGSDDIVVIKPNGQWWNQGVPNLAALKAFVDLIMERPGGFEGEVVLAENCHRGKSPWTSTDSAWAHPFDLNSDLANVSNLNEFSRMLKEKYKERISICHLINVDAGGKRVFGPAEGSGYVYCDGSRKVPLITCENGAHGTNRRATIMTYPIIVTDKGTVIDFKNGIWKQRSYTGQPFRFINLSALNHHSTYCGLTGAVKNYLGVTDLSGGPDPNNGGKLTEGYYNFHSFPFNKWSPGPQPGMLGAEIGTFIKTIRKADMNITTAEWVGLSSRVDSPVPHTRAVLASTGPVALDYHGAKYLLFPNSSITFHNPEDKKSPTHQYLNKCSESGGGIFDERFVKVISYDFKTGSFQKDDNLIIIGKRRWGSDPRAILKYLFLKYSIFA